MTLRYDLHIHSCLSPCGEDEMTPANLVGMAALLGLELIALTDHNTTANCRAAVRAGEQAGVLVLPGMELCTAEEAHIICVFAEVEAAEAFGDYVHSTLPPVRNRPQIYGNQLIVDEEDRVVGEEELLLVTASAVSVEQVVGLCREYGGACFPAHIDRSSYSVLSSLGQIAERWGFAAAELTARADEAQLCRDHPLLEGMRLLRCSDSHNLEDFAVYEPALLRLPTEATGSARSIVEFLSQAPGHTL